ncbi:phytoene desaturase family protein [Spongisporangium articulatum]|uniref:Phytoene desaturase family protein n=1 Tax=Spongisporangium articulatum TaxID=3362603 RepID=A0ABW8AKP9_9ACTN
MTADGFDAVVVGSGPNGLVAAVTLAEAGRRVLLVEAADRVGGALRSESFTLPGFVHDVGATVLPLALSSEAFRALRPQDHGVTWAQPEIPIAHPLEGADAVLVHRSVEETAAALGRDARAWRALVGATADAGLPLVDTLMSPFSLPRAPLAAARYGVSGALPASVLSRLAFREAPSRAMFAGIAAHAVLDLAQPITAGYALLMAALAHSVGWPVVQGGSERLAEVLAARLLALGGEIHTGTTVRSLRDVPPARSVLLDLTPRQVVAVAGDALPPRYRARLDRYRYGPAVFKMDWALDGPVPWSDPRVAAAGTIHVAGSFEEVVASERAMSRGRFSDRPYVLAVQPTAADPTRAPAGRHVFWAYCHVPNSSTVDRTDVIEDQIERFAPGFRERILARHVMSPKELEAYDANLVGGDIVGGAADLRQFVARPVLGLHPWATPVKGLYICSASTSPGGGVHGMCGYNAAKLALKRS